ncbi:hypothetical protein GN958_ATG14404, partial [Phytophthora infestans]
SNATLRERKPIDCVFVVQGYAVDDDNDDDDYDPERDPDDGLDDDLEEIPSTIRTADQGRHADVGAKTNTNRLKDNTDNAKVANEGEDVDVKRKCDGEQHVTGFEASTLCFVQAARDEVEKAARDEAEKAARVDAEKEAASSHTASEDDIEPVSGSRYLDRDTLRQWMMPRKPLSKAAQRMPILRVVTRAGSYSTKATSTKPTRNHVAYVYFCVASCVAAYVVGYVAANVADYAAHYGA